MNERDVSSKNLIFDVSMVYNFDRILWKDTRGFFSVEPWIVAV